MTIMRPPRHGRRQEGSSGSAYWERSAASLRGRRERLTAQAMFCAQARYLRTGCSGERHGGRSAGRGEKPADELGGGKRDSPLAMRV